MDLNKILLIGKVSQTPSPYMTVDGVEWISFVVATQPPGMPRVQHSVVVKAERLLQLAASLVTGQMVYVEGYVFGSITATSILVLDKKRT